ncbi:MAG: hypothetical protein KBD01_05770 [Acidobacteria bacterium]|nr:hypothetical protein [Acidobacteriota bacterium]
MSRRALSFVLVVCAVGVFAPRPCSAQGRRPDWWPEGRRPPYLKLSPPESEDRRAILLGSASFLGAGTSFNQPDPASGSIPVALRGAPASAGGWIIVRFSPRTSASSRRAILARHATLWADELPHDARLAYVPAAAVPALAAERGVEWVGRYHPAYKLPPLLGAGGGLREPGSPWRLDLRLAPELGGMAEVASLVTFRKGRVLQATADRLTVEIPDAATLVLLARHDAVLRIWETPEYVL